MRVNYSYEESTLHVLTHTWTFKYNVYTMRLCMLKLLLGSFFSLSACLNCDFTGIAEFLSHFHLPSSLTSHCTTVYLSPSRSLSLSLYLSRSFSLPFSLSFRLFICGCQFNDSSVLVLFSLLSCACFHNVAVLNWVGVYVYFMSNLSWYTHKFRVSSETKEKRGLVEEKSESHCCGNYKLLCNYINKDQQFGNSHYCFELLWMNACVYFP